MNTRCCEATLLPIAGSGRNASTNHGTSTPILLTGVPTGGTLTLHVLDESVAVPTSANDALQDLAVSLASAVNGSQAMIGLGVEATPEGTGVRVEGPDIADLGLGTTDPGLVVTPAPTAVETTVRDTYDGGFRRVIDVEWSNAASYDEIYVLKSGVIIGWLPGSQTLFTDEDPWSAPQDYWVVGVLNELPSAPGHPTTTTGVAPLPPRSPQQRLRLHAFPNPFNPQVTLEFELGRETTVSAEVYDLRGRLVRRLLTDRSLGAGARAVRWDGTTQDGARVASGTYRVRVTAGDQVGVTRVTMIK